MTVLSTAAAFVVAQEPADPGAPAKKQGARMPERIKASKTTINGVELNSPKAIDDGKKIMAFRRDAAVTAIQKLLQ